MPALTRAAEHVEITWEKRGAYRVSVVDLTERDHLEDRDLDGSIIYGLNTLWTDDADLRLYITTVQDG